MSLLPHTDEAGVVEHPNLAPTPKRRRLNLACNYCRSRKTKCDEQKPSCHACLAAGLVCITTDPKKPDRRVERREAGKRRSHQRSPVAGQTPEQTNAQHQAAGVISTECTSNTPLDIVESESTPARIVEHERPAAVNSNHITDEERYRGLLPIFKHDVSSSTVEILTGWLNVAFFRLGRRQRFSSRSPQDVEQPHIPILAQIPALPDPLQYQSWVSNYFQRVQSVYPVLDEEEILNTLKLVEIHGIEGFLSSPERLPHVIAALIVLQLGASGSANASPDDFRIHAVLKDLLGRLIGHPTLPNIKALFLSAINVYQHDDLTSAWSILCLCISMATSLRLGRPKKVYQTLSTLEDTDRKRTWWSICVFEKLLAFEMGRQSTIAVDGLSHFDPVVFSTNSVERDSSSAATNDDNLLFLRAVTSLAKLLGEIGDRCVQIREQEEVSEREEIQRLVAEKVKITGESCLQLTRWADNLPNHLRPGSDLIYDTCTFPHAAFLSTHYHNAVLVLTRNSLLISESALRVTTEVMAKDQPWRHIIRNGPPMVANTARKIIKLFIEAEENDTPMLIPHTNASLHALYVLVVNLTKHPNTMMADTDLSVSYQARIRSTSSYDMLSVSSSSVMRHISRENGCIQETAQLDIWTERWGKSTTFSRKQRDLLSDTLELRLQQLRMLLKLMFQDTTTTRCLPIYLCMIPA